MSVTDAQPSGPGESATAPRPAFAGGLAPARWSRVQRWLQRLPRYPELPPAPEGRLARVCLALVGVLTLAFVVYFAAYTFALHDAYQTFAEDMGIMDQALWNTVHGAPLHQTICNSVGDTNCLGDVSRFAIHFEPIMLPLALLYVVVPSPKTLQLLQALVVASGAFPAYWLASRRLRSALAGLAFAAVYLLYPALQAAVTYDFHAVTLSAAFLLFALYFMLTRNNRGLIIACLLAISTKEEVPLDILMIGLSIALLQRRWRLGLGLVALAALWIGVELPIMHAASPLGASPTTGRYTYLRHTSLITIVRQHILDRDGIVYLRLLLSPAAYLPLLSPFALLIAVPVLLLNLLSSNPTMRTGLYHYNAEIVPVLVFAAIESVALLAVVAARVAHTAAWRGVSARVRPMVGQRLPTALRQPARRFAAVPLARTVVAALTVLTALLTLREQTARGYTPLAHNFTWPQQSAHIQLAESFLQMIPPNASVSAQATLVPHLSHRRFVYQYPFMATTADYTFLDVTADTYPNLSGANAYALGVQALLADRHERVVAARDGYILLAHSATVDSRTATSDRFGLPAAFYSFTRLAPGDSIAHPLALAYGPSLTLVGYALDPSDTPATGMLLQVTTYWRVSKPLTGNVAPVLFMDAQGGAHQRVPDFITTDWRPMTTWQPGETIRLTNVPLLLTPDMRGTLRLSMDISVNGVNQTQTFATVPVH